MNELSFSFKDLREKSRSAQKKVANLQMEANKTENQ